MPGPSLIDERRQWSKTRIDEFCEAVSTLQEVTAHEELCIYVTGSFGRLEASKYSDLDLFFIMENAPDHAQMTRIDKILMDASLISKCKQMGFPEFSGDGEYLEVHYLQAMREKLGGRRDDYENLFTARLLLLLESLPIHNAPLYERVVREITESYFRDYPDHKDEFRPTFLVNDIIRFWKTLCLNYEHSRNRTGIDELEARRNNLKNLKLKFSRMLTCFSLVIPLAKTRDSIGPEECVRLMLDRPLQRLKDAAVDSGRSELWDTLANEYSWFLDLTGQHRDSVLNWFGSSKNRKEALSRAGVFGKSMYELLASVDLTPLLVSEASRVQLPLQHTPLATCLSTSCGV